MTEELKTLKDLFNQDVPYGWSKEFIDKELRQEAIKWIKHHKIPKYGISCFRSHNPFN